MHSTHSSRALRPLRTPKGPLGVAWLAPLLCSLPALAQPTGEPAAPPAPPAAAPEPAPAPSAPTSAPSAPASAPSAPAAASTSPPPSATGETAPTDPAVRATAPATAPVVIATGQLGTAGCELDAWRSAMKAARDGLVFVSAPDGAGLGLVMAPSGRVLTTLSLVHNGRGIEVRFDSDGAPRSARVVATDEDNDLALLEIEGVKPGASVAVSPVDPALGDSVFVMASAWGEDKGMLVRDVVVQPGVVTSVDRGRVRTSALDSQHRDRGAPLFDCSGRLVAMATAHWDDVAASTTAIRKLLDGTGGIEQPDYSEGWSIAHPSITFLAQLGSAPTGYDRTDAWLGGSLGLAVIGDDQWYFPIRLSLLGLLGPEPEGDLADRTGVRFQAQVGFGYRAMLSGGELPIYLVPQVSGVLSWEQVVESDMLFSGDLSQCGIDGTCPVYATPVEREEERFRVMPAPGLSLGFGVGEFGYQLQLDVEDMERTVHQLMVGAQF